MSDVQPSVDLDDFAKAFLEMAKLGEGETPAPEVPSAEPPAATGSDQNQSLQDPALAPGPEATDQPTSGEPAPSSETISDDDLLRRMAGLIKRAEPTPVHEAETQAAPQPAPQPQVPLFTPEQEQLLNKYREDFPDIHAAETLIRRSEYKELLAYAFNEVSRSFAPLVQQVQTMAQRMHLGDLQTNVPDYPSVRDQVIDWAGKQPAYIRSAYDRVIREGTPEEIKDMIDRFKRDTGVSQQQAAQAQAAPDPAKDPATRRAVAALTPVASKRSSTPRTMEPADFESAFALFSKEL